MITRLDLVPLVLVPHFKFKGARTSDPCPLYNCVAWAFGVSNEVWWPDLGSFWPVPFAGDDALGEFRNLFDCRGWRPCALDEWESLEAGRQKIALFADRDGVPTHTARMILDDQEFGAGTSGLWASKLGRDIDAIHPLEALCGDDRYGRVVAVYAKCETSAAPESRR